jgi:hypothetical protein
MEDNRLRKEKIEEKSFLYIKEGCIGHKLVIDVTGVF